MEKIAIENISRFHNQCQKKLFFIKQTDVGVIKIADSDSLQPGEYAIAIGNPLRFDNTVTTGIFSNTARRSSKRR